MLGTWVRQRGYARHGHPGNAGDGCEKHNQTFKNDRELMRVTNKDGGTIKTRPVRSLVKQESGGSVDGGGEKRRARRVIHPSIQKEGYTKYCGYTGVVRNYLVPY